MGIFGSKKPFSVEWPNGTVKTKFNTEIEAKRFAAFVNAHNEKDGDDTRVTVKERKK